MLCFDLFYSHSNVNSLQTGLLFGANARKGKGIIAVSGKISPSKPVYTIENLEFLGIETALRILA